MRRGLPLLAAWLLLLAGCTRGVAPAGPAAAVPSSSHTGPSAPGTAPPGDVLPGWLLIADEGNDRLLLVTPDKRVAWEFPRPGDLGPGESFRGPDDAFFTHDLREVLVNEEENQVVATIDVARHRILWQYGHPGRPGSAPGFLHTPDDAYPMPDGRISAAAGAPTWTAWTRQAGWSGTWTSTAWCGTRPTRS